MGIVSRALRRDERVGEAPPRLRELLIAADVTQPSSRVRPLPVDILMTAACNATNRVVIATTELERARRAVERCERELVEAETSRLEAQHALIRCQIEAGAFEGIRDFNALIQASVEDERDV